MKYREKLPSHVWGLNENAPHRLIEWHYGDVALLDCVPAGGSVSLGVISRFHCLTAQCHDQPAPSDQDLP